VTAIQRIKDAGGTFVSVREGLDVSTDTGRLILRVLFSIAEWELDLPRVLPFGGTFKGVDGNR
jgi:DNA invertase Pin-like site-specific DNA recombinase